MPIYLMNMGDAGQIQRVCGNDAVRARLAELGFVPGAQVQVVAVLQGSLIVHLKDSRVALDRSMAGRVLVQPLSGGQRACPGRPGWPGRGFRHRRRGLRQQGLCGDLRNVKEEIQ